MELRHLRYFVAVGDEEHYGRAAKQLHVAQPALSRQIQDLEEEIGLKLFDRLPRGVKISTAGKSFLDDARRILQQVNEATLREACRCRPNRNSASRLRGEHLLARCGARLIPGIPRTPARRGIATQTVKLFAAD